MHSPGYNAKWSLAYAAALCCYLPLNLLPPACTLPFKVGPVLGAKGTTIKGIREKSGASVKIRGGRTFTSILYNAKYSIASFTQLGICDIADPQVLSRPALSSPSLTCRSLKEPNPETGFQTLSIQGRLEQVQAAYTLVRVGFKGLGLRGFWV